MRLLQLGTRKRQGKEQSANRDGEYMRPNKQVLLSGCSATSSSRLFHTSQIQKLKEARLNRKNQLSQTHLVPTRASYGLTYPACT